MLKLLTNIKKDAELMRSAKALQHSEYQRENVDYVFSLLKSKYDLR